MLLQGRAKEGAIKPVPLGTPAPGAVPGEQEQSRAGVKDNRSARREPTERHGLTGCTLPRTGLKWERRGLCLPKRENQRFKKEREAVGWRAESKDL